LTANVTASEPMLYPLSYEGESAASRENGVFQISGTRRCPLAVRASGGAEGGIGPFRG
jgi:hypothetical protein